MDIITSQVLSFRSIVCFLKRVLAWSQLLKIGCYIITNLKMNLCTSIHIFEIYITYLEEKSDADFLIRVWWWKTGEIAYDLWKKIILLTYKFNECCKLKWPVTRMIIQMSPWSQKHPFCFISTRFTVCVSLSCNLLRILVSKRTNVKMCDPDKLTKVTNLSLSCMSMQGIALSISDCLMEAGEISWFVVQLWDK